MNDKIKELANRVGLPTYNPEGLPTKLEKFAELIVDECCFKLLMMDAKAQGSHNYYKHAALELKRNFTEKL